MIQISDECRKFFSRTPLGIGDIGWMPITEAVTERLEAAEMFLADVASNFHFGRHLDLSPTIRNAIQAAREYMTSGIPSFQRRIWFAAIDLVCDSHGQFWFVDDHYCCPMGLHQMYQLTSGSDQRISDASRRFREFLNAGRGSLRSIVGEDSVAVVLGSETFNTTYRDNFFFADFLGLPYVSQGELEMRPTGLMQVSHGHESRIGVVIRRLQDDDLDPNCFRPDSLQGVAGLVKGARSGKVNVLNAPGTGLFNSRAITRLIPEMISFYLGKEPLLPTIPTLDCSNAETMDLVRNAPRNYLLRTCNSMDPLEPLVGPTATRQERESYLSRIREKPGNFVARQTLASCEESGFDAVPVFGIRTFSVGTTPRHVLQGGLLRDCHPDGTPVDPIYNDDSLVPL
ncbi:MAG: circularly permuted type 2 ATP-grasp protein [Planctomycetaceae bacterium]|nr:circularly permuted type 2 ATP-grasp protein [Planctomycetaceae bacterium]